MEKKAQRELRKEHAEARSVVGKGDDRLFLRGQGFREAVKALSESPYVPNIYFVSSNAAKTCHVQHLLDLYGLPVRVYRKTFRKYAEDHDANPEQSIAGSVRYVADVLRHLGLFFIEDSSFSLSALSTDGNERPGLATKAFLKEYPFVKLDELLRSRGNDRGAKLISRVGLHLPGVEWSEVFVGITEGRIADSIPSPSASSGVPWLDEKSPANFFVPEGCEVPLSFLPLELSYDYDTRLRALHQMVRRLIQYASVAHNARIVFRRRPTTHDEAQLRLIQSPVLIVSGHSGSGKTTAALYLSQKYGFRYLEESDAVREAARQEGHDASSVAQFCDSKAAVEGPLFFINYLLRMHAHSLELPFVVSGIRRPEEAEHLKSRFPGAQLLFLEVPISLRYSRCTLGGLVPPASEERFRAVEHQEEVWGMGQIRELADLPFRNTGSLQALYRWLDGVAAQMT
jgi:hypothetical protein